MSDTSNLASNNIEPSMEDILSSIRKVIAEDLSQKKADDDQASSSTEDDSIATADIAPADIADAITPIEVESSERPVEEYQAKAEAAFDDILELDDLLGDENEADDTANEVMELIQLDDETVTEAEAEVEVETEKEAVSTSELDQELDKEFEILTTPSPDLPTANANMNPETDTDTETGPTAENPSENTSENSGFDETLDLVMDSDASNYVTEKLQSVTDAPSEETAEAPKTTANYDGPLVDIANHALFDAELTAVTHDADTETSLSAQEPEPIPEDAHTSSKRASSKDDMDLVKSLLEDLMDEPLSEETSASVTTTVETIVSDTALSGEDGFSEDDLLIPEPEAEPTEVMQSEAMTAQIQAAPVLDIQESIETSVEEDAEDIFDALASDTLSETTPENMIENELAQIAREIAEARDMAVETVPVTDDIVELSTPDYASELAVSASLAGSAARGNNKPEGIVAAAAEKDLESLQQLIAETNLDEIAPEAPEAPAETVIPDEIEMLISPMQEEETMATPVKNDVLSDADTQQEVGNAFASLTTTVQEHALAEENGPPIGELVKEALKPMLQEWLDKNLKAMVQRAVTKEIKRISASK
jgi:Protein of unknown function (DUF2497)